MGYEISAGDTSMVLYNYDKDNTLLGSTKYTKVLNKPLKNDLVPLLQYAINKKLFAGTYSFSDINGKTLKATFTNDGKVIGLPDFKTYYVSTDFGPESDRDQLFFDIQPDKFFYDLEPKDQKRYLFKLAGDTLNIFNISPKRDETGGLNFGSLKYSLVKVR